MDSLVILIIAALMGLIPAKIASDKGRSFGLWWFFGWMLWIVAFPMSIIIRKDEKTIAIREGTLKCPHCLEWGIKKGATVCRYCGRTIV
jgi:hypothetical protein